MIRKLNGTITIYVVLLFAAFAVVSLMVVLTRGHGYFLLKKLRLGGLIIGLSGFVVTGTACTPMCYDPASPTSQLDVDDLGPDNTVAIDLAGDRVVNGTISERGGVSYSYVIYQSTRDTDAVTGALEPVDGAFDESTEEYRLEVPDTIEPGVYTLEFIEVAELGESYLYPSYTLIVTDSRE